jgi:hypothetical protein
MHAVVVVVSSGIIGASFARRILDSVSADGHHVIVVMLGARDACSGATGRQVSYLLS